MENFSKRFVRRQTLFLGFLASFSALNAETILDFEPRPSDDAAWYDEAKYGMFIHWGLYSELARGEWVMLQENIPLAEYEKIAEGFNPVKFDADAWVRLAKAAGMKYITITSKHHDGFALFKSEASDFNIVDATPFKRDVIKELKEACDREGIKLGLYYSQAQDWYHLGGIAANRIWDEAQLDHCKEGDMQAYIENLALPQVRELITNYDPALIWFDTPFRMQFDDAMRFSETVNELSPHMLINSRIRYNGRNTANLTRERRDELASLDVDYLSYRDREIPESSPWPYWETCMTLNHSWGYTEGDSNWKSSRQVIQQLVEVVSKGGTFLLNIGPTGAGEIPAESVRILLEAGAWLEANGEAVYGAEPTAFKGVGAPDLVSLEQMQAQAEQAAKTGAGKVKKVEPEMIYDWLATSKGNKVYIHLFEWPEGAFELSDCRDTVTQAYLLREPAVKLSFQQEEGRLSVDLPSEPLDSIATVLCLEF
jgi:alpha-L-fucosidase